MRVWNPPWVSVYHLWLPQALLVIKVASELVAEGSSKRWAGAAAWVDIRGWTLAWPLVREMTECRHFCIGRVK